MFYNCILSPERNANLSDLRDPGIQKLSIIFLILNLLQCLIRKNIQICIFMVGDLKFVDEIRAWISLYISPDFALKRN